MNDKNCCVYCQTTATPYHRTTLQTNFSHEQCWSYLPISICYFLSFNEMYPTLQSLKCVLIKGETSLGTCRIKTRTDHPTQEKCMNSAMKCCSNTFIKRTEINILPILSLTSLHSLIWSINALYLLILHKCLYSEMTRGAFQPSKLDTTQLCSNAFAGCHVPTASLSDGHSVYPLSIVC